MKVIDTDIPDVKIIEPTIFSDERGFFMETWNQQKFEELVTGKPTDFVQDNHSKSKKGVLRGLHLQTEKSQGKLVRVISGEVFDVAVDLRKNSETYGSWVGVYLSQENRRQLWIPEGFAHGFYVTKGDVDFLYKCTNYYHPSAECTIKWDDKDINVRWPIDGNVLISERDSSGISLKSFEKS